MNKQDFRRHDEDVDFDSVICLSWFNYKVDVSDFDWNFDTGCICKLFYSWKAIALKVVSWTDKGSKLSFFLTLAPNKESYGAC
ncbi:hypothetical protein QVD17_38023 [Tagetes erecta]|uniref:Uncharacterized protein n=1 Tax=Tagetes erecta TaxID=13708 RepID=A0AAD8JVA0_TARER|nr:hypothetical protein QVD17_38023 [Tagetes erecta]